MTERNILYYMAIGWTVVILAGCSIPGDGLPPALILTDKVIHIIIFALFGYLWRMAGYGFRWILLAGIAYGLLTEIWQGVMPLKRSFDLFDALADSFGTILGMGLGWLVQQLIRLRHGNEPFRYTTKLDRFL